MGEWDSICRKHTKEKSFFETINSLPCSTFILTPGLVGSVNFSHHGLSHTPEIEKDENKAVLFATGNFDGSPFKVLDVGTATRMIPQGTKTRGGKKKDMALTCPSLQDMCNANSVEEFKNLPMGSNEILHDRPNHFLVSGGLFIKMRGIKSAPAAKVGFTLVRLLKLPEKDKIQNPIGDVDTPGDSTVTVTQEDEEDDELDQETEEILEARKQYESLLAYLWLIANIGSSYVPLLDIPEDPILFGQSKLKVTTPATPTPPAQPATPPAIAHQSFHLDTPAATNIPGHVNQNTLAIATQALVMTLSNMDKERQDNRKADLKEKALF